MSPHGDLRNHEQTHSGSLHRAWCAVSVTGASPPETPHYPTTPHPGLLKPTGEIQGGLQGRLAELGEEKGLSCKYGGEQTRRGGPSQKRDG